MNKKLLQINGFIISFHSNPLLKICHYFRNGNMEENIQVCKKGRKGKIPLNLKMQV